MIDITTITEVLDPFTIARNIPVIKPPKSNWLLWLLLLIAIAGLIIWGYYAYHESLDQSRKKNIVI